MLTMRSKKIKTGFQSILTNLKRMAEADEKFKELQLSLSQNEVYSAKYKDQKREEARKSVDLVLTGCAESIAKELETLYEVVEGMPDPIETNDETVQNMLSMIRLTECKLPFEQLQYFVDQSRGNFVLLKVLAETFKSYGQEYFANQCLELAEEFPIYKIEEMAGVNGRVLFNPRDYNAHDWVWFKIDIEKYLKQLNAGIVSAPSYKEQVAKLKETLAARNREIEMLKEKDATHIGIIDHLLDKE